MQLKIKEDLSAYYRGSLIQKTIDLELRIDILIGRFLSMNNQNRVIDIVEIFDLTEIAFSAKKKIISFIVKKHFKNFLTINEDFFKDLGYVMENRNILAHRRHDLDTNDFLKLSWAKSADKSIQTTSHIIDQAFYSTFENKCSESYIRLIQLECEIMKWAEQQLSKDS